MNEGDGAPFEIPVPFFLLTHPQGHTLIDGGNAVEVATHARSYWGNICDVYHPVMTPDDGCVAQLKRLGIAPEDIRFVVQSHLHLDHTGAIGRFPNATYIVQRQEYEYAFTADWFSKGGYIRKDFDRSGLKWRFLEGEVNDFHDIYGDGTLTTIFTPGHSPGHQSLLVRLTNTGSILLTIDAAYTLDHWNEKSLPGFLTSAIQSVRSVQKLHTVKEQTNAMVVTGHDPDAWQHFKHAPAYYT